METKVCASLLMLIVLTVVFSWVVLLQHHLLSFQLTGHRDDGRSHQATFPQHDGVQSNAAVQSFR